MGAVIAYIDLLEFAERRKTNVTTIHYLVPTIYNLQYVATTTTVYFCHSLMSGAALNVVQL